MRKGYMKTMDETIIACNRKAFLYGDGKAWDNRKRKTFLRHAPRGKVYRRLLGMEWKRVTDPLILLAKRMQQSGICSETPCPTALQSAD